MERITRAEDRVHRPAGPWTPTVHRLLAHLHERGFVEAPEPIALGEVLETVSFIPGLAGEYPWTDDVASEAALVTAARLLRNYHDAAATYAVAADDVWSQADRAPVETICHGDFAPYNCVFDGRAAVGIIDFDTAHPGPRVWDVASAVYRFAPLTTGDTPVTRLDDQLARAAEFCRAYDLDASSRAGLVEAVVAGLVALVTTIESEAAAGDPKFARDLAAGHAELYRADVAYIEHHADAIRHAVA
ncbi:aminoglycoside phosphotransferase family protein [Curtobacterium sp. MCBD17_034]|uniref:phosphotransferase n=1 Tax=unclassified Curtobacterium TaxID=257496 RepID=UPI000DA83F73|nr:MULTISPECIES: aminoglycoside phosphotransferase family protein [unclassified Curtobacterium]PZE76699.1 aminoglycoside phosphotransferase family protein [Curtobacterium sp. MCBD17_019]PZF61064.1 aminoglycoside phosphotransferase family protein [Curtobacterium sp. MCBD17_034]PZF66205.1 aminoglycoside phosphotransferase family protein [Curtobacterium sp. MCBD17_013]PZM40414.1 aminoglycoside phosphotransferase family protein [Curtobacterium sp. MCBD17_031]WIB64748.1 aminoglycoside phosphotransf